MASQTPELSNSLIIQAAEYVAAHFKNVKFDAAIVLGSGLSAFHQVLTEKSELTYSQIPNMPKVTVAGHEGKLISGKINNVTVLCFSGRFHSYEGIPWTHICFQVQLMSALGIKLYILTNATGGLLDGMQPGSYMTVIDHIRFSGRADPNFYFSPIESNHNQIVKQDDYWNEDLAKLTEKVAKLNGLNLFSGSYCWTTGPCYETPCEVLMLKSLGGGVVGMSTVPEVLMARQVGIRTVGFSMATNLGAGLQKHKLSHEEVNVTANKSMGEFISLISKFLIEFGAQYKNDQGLFLTPSIANLRTDVKLIDKQVFVEPLKRENVLKQCANMFSTWKLKADVAITAAIFAKNLEQQEINVSLHSDKAVMLCDMYPVNTCAGKTTKFYITHRGHEYILLVDMGDDAFSTEESSFMAVLFQELGVRRVLMQVSNPIALAPVEGEVVPVSDVYNHSAQTRPLAYLYHMVPNLLSSSFTFQFNPGRECSFMSFAGPSLPSKAELKMAQLFGANYAGTFSLMPYYAFRFCGIGVNLAITTSVKFSSSFIENWLVQSVAAVPYQHTPICQLPPNMNLIKRKVVQYADVEAAVQFVKEQFPQLQNEKVATAIMDMDLNLPLEEFADTLASLPLSKLPFWQDVYYNSRRAIHEPNKQRLALLKVKSTGQLCFACVGPLAYSDEPNYVSECSFLVRLFQGLHVSRLLFSASMMTAFYKKGNDGSRSPLFETGSLIYVQDHVSLIGENPMIGHNEPRWGPRFYDMTDVYSASVNQQFVENAKKVLADKPHLIPQPAKCLYHANSNFQEYSKLERTYIAEVGDLQVLATAGCREIIVARHHEQEAKGMEINYLGLIVGDGAYSDALIEKCYSESKRAIAQLLTMATQQ